MHERERVKFGVPRHGFIHDDIPHEKWVDFVKAAGKLISGGKPSTWFPPGGHAERPN